MRTSEVWLNGKFHGTMAFPIDSVAARAVLKGFGLAVVAEVRDSNTDTVYRYDSVINSLRPVS